MSQPTLFLFCQDAQLENSILTLDAIAGFVVTKCSKQATWLDILEECDPDVAIIEITAPQDLNAQYFHESEKLKNIDLLKESL